MEKEKEVVTEESVVDGAKEIATILKEAGCKLVSYPTTQGYLEEE